MSLEYPFLKEIVDRYQKCNRKQRFMVGIVGVPGSGKSTLTEQLPAAFDTELGAEVSTHFNLDGYHYYNGELRKRGIYPDKGAHFTFDVQKFIDKLAEIKENEGDIFCPVYDRKVHNPIPDANVITTDHRIVFVEGNYLLLTVQPWVLIRAILDYCIFLEIDKKIQFQRLMGRHQKSGRSQKEAEEKIRRTDIPNAELIDQDKDRADFIYRPLSNFQVGPRGRIL